jgi:hypothetical protein
MAAFLALVILSTFGVGVGLGWWLRSLPTGHEAPLPTASRSRPEPAVMRLMRGRPYDWEREA